MGFVVGTPDYMAPEQLLGDALDARTDLYAVGVVLYECLTGNRPFSADTPEALAGLKLTGTYRPPHELNAEIPRKLSDVVMQLLARTRNERPASASVLHDMLVAAEA
jgi:serine/threonine-protein kinase